MTTKANKKKQPEVSEPLLVELIRSATVIANNRPRTSPPTPLSELDVAAEDLLTGLFKGVTPEKPEGEAEHD